MMNHLFHVITIFFIAKEFIYMATPIDKTKSSERYYRLNKLNKDKEWDNVDKEYKNLVIKKGFFAVVTFSWVLFGLITYNWAGFVLLLVFNIAIIGPISRVIRFSMAYTILHWVNSLIGFVFGVFVLLNSYHLRIDLYELILNLF